MNTFNNKSNNFLSHLRMMLIFACFAILPSICFSQSMVVYGKVVSNKSSLPVIGANVIEKGNSNGTVSDSNGEFSLSVNSSTATIEFSCVGFEPKTYALNGKGGLGTITLNEASVTLSDVIVTSQVATTRKTPIAASTITYNELDEKLGSQEFVEALKYTPSVHANRQGGGWCDSEIYMRGFDNTNIAVMINGIPMNDVENGSVYWSNWAGISDVVSLLQTQRGIGASKLSSPSVGGTINIVTKGIETERGGSIYQMIGNDGYHKTSFTINSGLNKHGWAFTLLGSYAAGDGYAQGTSFKSYNYFLNVSKRINSEHQLSLQFFGAPQKHYGRSNALTESEWDNIKKYMTDGKHWTRYNPDYGFDINGKRKTADFNEYHMPQIFLNHTWQINYKSNLSTTAYVSIGRGNGYSGDGTAGYSEYDWYGSDYGVLNTKFRKIDGTFDYAAIQQLNAESANGSKMIMTKQRGDHDWYGLVSTFESQLHNRFNYQLGVDFRYTKATHVNTIVDLFSGDYYIDYSRQDVDSKNNPLADDESWVNAHLGVGDAVHRDYDSHIVKGGVFGQIEYARDNISAFVAGSLNNSTYWRYDRLYYAPSTAKSDNYNYLGSTFKVGANYNINSFNNIFLNLGLITKAPQFKNGVFMSANTSNVINKDVKNEKSFSIDLGYGFHNTFISFNANAYLTKWMDKTMTKKGKMSNKKQYYMNMTGVGALHIGLEFELKTRPTSWLDINAMLSIGRWTWNGNNVKGYAYDINGNALTSAGETTSPGADDHAWAVINLKDVKVGGSAQTTAGIEALVKPFKNLRLGAGYNLLANNYAYYSIGGGNLSLGKEMVASEPWKIPTYGNLDLLASHQFKVGSLLATLSGQIYNVLGEHNIEKAWNPSNIDSSVKEVNPADVYMFYTPGRTWSLKLKLNF